VNVLFEKSFRDCIKLTIVLVMIAHLGILLFNLKTTWYMLIIFVLLYLPGVFWNIYAYIYPKKSLGVQRFMNSILSFLLIYLSIGAAYIMDHFYNMFNADLIINSFIIAFILVLLLFILETKIASEKNE